MKRTILTFIFFIGFATLLSGQVVRSGVVRRTTNVVKVEEKKPEKPVYSTPYGHEIGHFTHSAAIILGYEDYGDEIFGLEYSAQYRFSPLFSAGGGIWAGWWWPFGILPLHHFGFEPRINGKFHPLAEKFPKSPFQPYAALWIGTLIPRYENKTSNYEQSIDSYVIFTPEIGCDWYTGGRTLFAAISFNWYKESEWSAYYDSWSGEYHDSFNDWTIFNFMLKAGIRF